MSSPVPPAPQSFSSPAPSSVVDIPSAPSFSVFGQAAAAAVSSAANQVMSAYQQASANMGGSNNYQYPSAANNPGASRAPPLNNADPRVKDTVEICNFVIAALKVWSYYDCDFWKFLFSHLIISLCDVQHNEIALARERLQEALRRLG